jgi:hypothetical protein
MKKRTPALVLAVLASAWAGTAVAKTGWKAGNVEADRARAGQVLLVSVARAVEKSGKPDTCRIEATAIASERGKPVEPGSPLDVLVPCGAASAPGQRSVPMTALDAKRLARLYLSRGGKALDYEPLESRADDPGVAAEAADRKQLWRLITVNSKESLLIDTDDVERQGATQLAWVKRNFDSDSPRRIVQIVTRSSYDCERRTSTLHLWYARTGSVTVDSQGVVPESGRRAAPVAPNSASDIALKVLCRADR